MRNTNEEQNLIINWYRISVGEEIAEPSIYFKFMASWVSLNALYNFFCIEQNKSGNDKKKLKYFACEDTDAKTAHSQLLQNNSDYKNAITFLKDRGGIKIGKSANRINITNDTIFEDVILCVYQARNNFFHGDKDVRSLSNRDVVTNSHTIVSKFLQKYFNI